MSAALIQERHMRKTLAVVAGVLGPVVAIGLAVLAVEKASFAQAQLHGDGKAGQSWLLESDAVVVEPERRTLNRGSRQCPTK